MKIRVLKNGFALDVLNVCRSTLFPIKKHPYKINQEVKKKYEMTEIINNRINTIAINAIIGIDIIKNKTIFHVGYSNISFLVARESKNRNIKNTKKGKKTTIPINDTISFGKGTSATPINNQITTANNRQFLPIFFKLSTNSIKK
jgi:hypothetical protein